MRLAVLLLVAVLTAACTDGPATAPSPHTSASTSASPAPGTEPAAPVAFPKDATEVAGSLRTVEQEIAAGPMAAARLTRVAQIQQRAYRTWSDHPDWDARILASLPAGTRGVARDNLAARRALRSIYPSAPGQLPRELPAWHVEQPAPLGELLSAYHEAERRTGVDWTYLAAINFVESDFGRINGVSDAGAQGPMQFIPTTWDMYGAGGDIHDPHDAVIGAGRLLAANGFADGPVAALHHYNNSDGYVRAITLLAGIIREHPRELAAYHSWSVYYLTARGPILLPEGYRADHPIPVDRWLADHPQDG